jgi:hypothetical protein
MSFLTADPLNCEIIALSLGVQREISKDEGAEGSGVGRPASHTAPAFSGKRKHLPFTGVQSSNGRIEGCR